LRHARHYGYACPLESTGLTRGCIHAW
jgi:hypothetical protein